MCLSRWHSLNTRGSMYTWSTVLPPVAVMGFCAGFTRWLMFYHALSPFNISNILESPPQLKLHTCLFLFSPLRSFIQRMNILLDLKCFLELSSRSHDPTTPNFYMPAKLVLYSTIWRTTCSAANWRQNLNPCTVPLVPGAFTTKPVKHFQR